MEGKVSVQMSDTKFMTAKQKRATLRDWRGFLAGGCQEKDFTAALYHHLIQHCSFIAHYNREGFYGSVCSTPERLARFLRQFDSRLADSQGLIKSVEIGMTYWMKGEYEDINQAMVEIATEYIPGLLDAARRVERDRDLELAHGLIAKWKGVEL